MIHDALRLHCFPSPSSCSPSSYINYPFIPQTVELMDNYTSIANDLGMAVKFYYTIRELSNHAVELFALRSLQGEVIIDGDPDYVPQPG